MSRIKIPRKSTAIDMTAMCDVAFLLLTFFILTAKLKQQDPLQFVIGQIQVTTQAMGELLEKGVGMSLFSRQGHLKGVAEGAFWQRRGFARAAI